MGLITLGSLTFTRNPGSMTPLEDVRFNAYVKTYSSVAHFSWGPDIVGKEIDLSWNYMENSEFSNLRTIYEADNEVILDPNDGSGKTFDVELINLNSTYFRGRGVTAERVDIKLTLLVTEEN